MTKIPAGIGMFPLLIFSFAFYVVAKVLLIFSQYPPLLILCSILLFKFSHLPPFLFGCHPFFPQKKGGRGQIHLPIARLTSYIQGDAKPNAQYTTSNTNKTVFRVVIVRINIVFVASLRWQQTKHFFVLFIILHVFRVQSVNLISLG